MSFAGVMDLHFLLVDFTGMKGTHHQLSSIHDTLHFCYNQYNEYTYTYMCDTLPSVAMAN